MVTAEKFTALARALFLRQVEQKIQVYNLIAELAPASVTGDAQIATLQKIDAAMTPNGRHLNGTIRRIAKDKAEAAHMIREMNKLYPRRRTATAEPR